MHGNQTQSSTPMQHCLPSKLYILTVFLVVYIPPQTASTVPHLPRNCNKLAKSAFSILSPTAQLGTLFFYRYNH